MEDYRRSRPVDRTYTCQGWVWRTRSDFVLCGSGDSGRGVRLKLAGLAEARCASSPPRVEGAVALDQGVEIARPPFKNCVNTEAETSMACFSFAVLSAFGSCSFGLGVELNLFYASSTCRKT